MGRLLTLRGVLAPLSSEILVLPEVIFDYESAGTSRGWKVIRWEMWPCDFGVGGAWTSATLPNFRHTLYLDDGANPAALDAAENRAIGWSYHTCSVGKEQTCLSPVDHGVVIDPDHLVTGRLFIGSATCCHHADNALTSTWSYLIEIEDRRITPAENIISTLKGRGQDVTT